MLTSAWTHKKFLWPQALGVLVMCSTVLLLVVHWVLLTYYQYYGFMLIVMYCVLTIPHKSQCHEAWRPKQSMAV